MATVPALVFLLLSLGYHKGDKRSNLPQKSMDKRGHVAVVAALAATVGDDA